VYSVSVTALLLIYDCYHVNVTALPLMFSIKADIVMITVDKTSSA